MKFQRILYTKLLFSHITLSLSLINFNTNFGIILSSYDDSLFTVIPYKQ